MSLAQSTVHVSNDEGLRTALSTSASGNTIVFDNSITLTADLPSVSRDITIDGGGFALSGNNKYRGFLVMRFETSPTPTPVNVTIQNLTFQNTAAIGGTGGAGTVGGGGGAGLGGALYVGDQATVTISNVNFSASSASGGTGGLGAAGVAPAGGGGLGGNGGAGDSGTGAGGGGGGVGTGAFGGSLTTPNGGTGILRNALSGGSSSAGAGGPQGGGGAAGGLFGFSAGFPEGGAGGGNGGGNSNSNPNGAPGAFGGGSGGSSTTSTLTSSAGYGGGGGGGTGGVGGFGGGGGGSTGANAGGFAGGSGSAGGGGGAGLGGAVFVQSGGTLTIAGGASVTGNSVAGGAGASGGGAGSSFGSGFFLQGNGVLTVAPNGSQTQTISDVIADQTGSAGSGGSWSVTKNGTGTLNLSGANTFTGGVVVNAGVIGVNADNNLGQGGTLALNNGTAILFNGNSTFAHKATIAGTSQFRIGGGQSVTWAGLIANGASAGSLQLAGGGVLSLTNSANSYSGGTSVTNGSTLAVSVDGVMGTGGLALGDAGSNGTLRVLDGSSLSSSRSVFLGGGGGIIDTVGSASVSLNGPVSGAGSLTKVGGGTLTLGGASSYSGGTNLNGGTLRVSSSNVFGSSAMNVSGGTTLDLNGFNQSLPSLSGSGAVLLGSATLSTGGDGSTTTFSGPIAGSGSLVKTGGGTFTLQGANTYTGGTIISGGTLSGNTSSLQGNIVNNAAVIFTQGSDGAYRGSLSGSGSLLKNGGGRLTLNGSHSMTGLATIAQGSLALNGSLAGSVLASSGTTFLMAGSVGGGVTVNGGTFLMSGTVGGGVAVNGGTFQMSGTVGGGVTANGGTVTGSGAVGGSVTLNGGTLTVGDAGLSSSTPALVGSSAPRTAAGDPAGGLTIGTNLAANSGATIGLTLASAAQAPIMAAGTGTLADSHLNLTLNSFTSTGRITRYAAMSADRGLQISNTDINVTSQIPNLVPLLVMDRTTLVLALLDTSMPIGQLGTSANGRSVGAAIDKVRQTAVGDLGVVVRELSLLDDPQIDPAFQSIAGEIHGSEIHLAALDSEAFTDVVRDEVDARESDAEEPPGNGPSRASNARPQFWAQIHGDRATFNGAGGASGANATVGGFASGLDWHFSEKWFVGAGGGYSRGSMKTDAFGGASDETAPHAFVSAGFNPPGPWAFNFGFSGSHASYNTRRRIAFASTFPGAAGVNREADSAQAGVNNDIWTEFEDSVKVGGWNYDARVGYRRANYGRGAWSETGAQSLSLKAAAQSQNSKQSDIRINAFKRTGAWRPHWSFAYKRELGNRDTSTNVQLADASNTQFVVNGLPMPATTLTARGGVTYHSALGLQYTLDYEVHRAAGQADQGLHFRVRFK
jgi:autotransporter-associated beta strand protein